MLKCQGSVPDLPPHLSHLRGVVGHGLHHGGLAWELLWVVGDVGRVRGGGHQRWTSGGSSGLHHGRGGGWLVLVRALGGQGACRRGEDGAELKLHPPAGPGRRTQPLLTLLTFGAPVLALLSRHRVGHRVRIHLRCLRTRTQARLNDALINAQDRQDLVPQAAQAHL